MPDENAKGFDGLSGFSTDVDGAIAAADRIASGPRRASPSPSPSPPPPPSAPVHRDSGAVAGGLKKVGGWILGIGLIVAVKACVFGGIHALSGSSSTTSSYYSPSSSDQSADAVTDMNDMEALADNMTSATTEGATPSIGEAVDATGADAPTNDAPSQDDGAMTKPQPGYATLSLSEVRYCMAEDVRIAAQKTELDRLQFSDVERFNRNVDGFNDTVNDYNSSCSNRSIMADDRPVATSQVERQRSQLEADGRDRVQ